MFAEVLAHPLLFELVLETIFFVGLWEAFFVRTLMPQLHSWASKRTFWAEIMRRRGTLAKSGQTDLILLMVLTVHHTIAGSLMLSAAFFNSGLLWRHGALMELGFELADLVSNIRGVWPYEKGKVANDIRIALALHHLPGIMLLFPLIMFEYHENQHLQAIGGWLLLGAAVSAGVGCVVYTRNFDDETEMKQAAIAQVLGAASFMYARWYVYPIEAKAFQMDTDLRTDLPETFPMMVRAMTITLGLFNLAVTIALFPKTVRYVIKGFFTKNVDLDDLPENEAIPESGNKSKQQ